MLNYEFISKALFFPEKKILVIGDLHIGYETMIKQSGILIPESQVKELIQDLKKIFEIIKSKKQELKKIIFIGDIKHSFGFEKQERNEFEKIIEFLRDFFPQENIIFIKGNHDTVDYTHGKNMKSYHIDREICFVHGDQDFPKMFEAKIKMIVMGHIHPSVLLHEKPGVKRETYKCFLEGKYKGKNFIVMPSFLDFSQGLPVNNYKDGYEDFFSILPKRSLLNFRIHVIGEDKVYDFGKVRELK